MNITPSALAHAGYTVLDTLPHDELLPFVKIYSKKKTKAALWFKLSNIFNLVLLTGLASYSYITGSALVSDLFVHFCYGTTLSFLLIPLHELLHGAAYKYVGAPKTSYVANLKKFYFAAVAHNFVASRDEFRIVALLPFLCISVLCLAGVAFLHPHWAITAATTLLVHTAFCQGDFALLGYFEFHKKRAPVTYDDALEKVTYFLTRD